MSAKHPAVQQRSARFPTTHWSVVVAAGHQSATESRDALALLCKTYWYPLYAFVRRSGYSRDDAQDLVQGFFACFLQKPYLRDRSPDQGRFRSYLLKALRHYIANEHDRATAQKRGGGHRVLSLELDMEGGERRYLEEVSTGSTPEIIYEQRWALSLLSRVLGRLRKEHEVSGKTDLFNCLEDYLQGPRCGPSYQDSAHRLSMTVAGVKAAVFRLRRRYGDVLRQEVSHTVSEPEKIDDEVRHLIAVLSD